MSLLLRVSLDEPSGGDVVGDENVRQPAVKGSADGLKLPVASGDDHGQRYLSDLLEGETDDPSIQL